jgi:flagellar biosynthesis GTPase FlhF
MRIKSYFAPSVQNAITLARKEFGDDITLVTSHAVSLDARHLGEYEVVFAIEEPAAVAEVMKGASAEPFEFKQVLEQAVTTVKAPVTVDTPAKLDQIRSLLIEVGIDAPMVNALMTVVQRCAGAPAATACETAPAAGAVAHQPAITAAEVNPSSAKSPQFTAAELAFFRSVAAPES